MNERRTTVPQARKNTPTNTDRPTDDRFCRLACLIIYPFYGLWSFSSSPVKPSLSEFAFAAGN